MSENLQVFFPNSGIEASYNDGSIFTYIPTSNASLSYNTRPTYKCYNWYASTAEKGVNVTANDDIDGSICPKGWKLPYNYSVNPSVSWGALTDAYGITTNGLNTSSSTGFQTLENIPISLVRDGRFANGEGRDGNIGFYWSSTASDSSYDYNMEYDKSYVYPQSARVGAINGLTVRCVASPLVH